MKGIAHPPRVVPIILIASIAALLLAAGASVEAAIVNWDGGGANDLWTNPNNWNDGNATNGAALYASAFILAGGTAQIPSITGNGFNIYYDPANSANAYLANRSYPLTGGGSLIPVPEPSGAVMLGLGAVLTLLRNRSIKRGHHPSAA